MSDILQEIIANKRYEVEIAKQQRPLERLLETCQSAPPVRSFAKAITDSSTPRIIAECKRQSPSKGILVHNYNPVALALAYQMGGAAAISVLTDTHYFGGTLADLRMVRSAVDIPVLRKDFIVDPYQVYEARAAGADSFLLLSGVLSTTQLDSLISLGRSLGMEPLIESHSAQELAAAIASCGRILGINNRNLKDFSVDLDIARKLFEQGASSRPDRIMVCESGIKSPADVEKLSLVGYKAFLVGEALVTHPNPTAAIKALIQ